MDAQQLFDQKWPGTQRAVNFHARRLGIRDHDLADLLQIAALCLWEQCRQCVRNGTRQFEISAQVICQRAIHAWARARKRNFAVREADFDDEAADVLGSAPARPEEVRVAVDDATVCPSGKPA